MSKVIRLLLNLEPLWLAFMLAAFWYPSPTRDGWLWLLWGLPLFAALRYAAGTRLDWRQPLLWVLATGFALMALNGQVAPYTRGLLMLGRPALGVALIVGVADAARRSGHLNDAANALLIFAVLVALLGLTAAQWTTKSAGFVPVLDLLPRFTGFPSAEGGLNVNELGGALAWLTPLCAAFTGYGQNRPRRWAFAGLTLLLLLAAFFGQSRFALAGILLALVGVVTFTLRGRPRWVGWAAVVALGGLQLLITLNVFMPVQADSRFERDESSMSIRLDIWNSALTILGEHPLTGVGLGMFRDGRVRTLYPVPSYGTNALPHAHNELLQIGADMGWPGLAWFIALHGAALGLLWGAYQRGSPAVRSVAVGVGGGLLAHGVFGLGDAIPLWDRFAFLLWLLLALAAGAAVVARTSQVAASGELDR
jgi:putative inorganic carbon (HCO3(-)) transporter